MSGMIVLEDLGNQYGYEALAPTSSTGITSTLIRPTSGPYAGMTPRAVLIGVETQPIRFRMDGTAATADNGVLLKADSYFTMINFENIKNFRCIDTAAGASKVTVLVFF